jgi:hypothetical protein
VAPSFFAFPVASARLRSSTALVAMPRGVERNEKRERDAL